MRLVILAPGVNKIVGRQANVNAKKINVDPNCLANEFLNMTC